MSDTERADGGRGQIAAGNFVEVEDVDAYFDRLQIPGLPSLVAQVEAMVQGVDGAEGFDALAWTSRWLREPLPAFGGVAPLSYMGTTEGQVLVSETLARIQSGAYG
jgi:hypothetical protein